jgi:protein SCO1
VKTFIVSTVVAVTLATVLAASDGRARPLPYYTDATLTPRWLIRPDADSMHSIGDFSFTDQEGHRATRATVAGRIYVASFFYTTCRTLCPELRDELARVRDAYRGDTSVMILSHSVIPEADDVGRLAHYAFANGIDQRQWLLLTGSRAEVARVARERYFVELADTTGNTKGVLRHTETLVLVDGGGHIRGVYHGSLPFEVTQLINDIRTLKQERSL